MLSSRPLCGSAAGRCRWARSSNSVRALWCGWNCSPACTEERLRVALRRELEGRGMGAAGYRHRLPLGLLMMEQGWITSRQLRQALEQQRAGGGGKLGHVLVRQQAASEELV